MGRPVRGFAVWWLRLGRWRRNSHILDLLKVNLQGLFIGSI